VSIRVYPQRPRRAVTSAPCASSYRRRRGCPGRGARRTPERVARGLGSMSAS
jgi:hypothetical protein